MPFFSFCSIPIKLSLSLFPLSLHFSHTHFQIALHKIMGHSRFLLLLLVSSLLFLSFGHGFGRVALMETVEDGDSIKELMEHARKMRVVYEIMDYSEPEPNTNPKNGHFFSPPSPTPAAPPRA